MKKVFKLLFVSIIGVSMLPINCFALQQDVGVKVNGDISISAVTTISSDVNINVEDKTTSKAYIEFLNKSTVPLNVKVTDIEALSNNAPSTFVGFDEDLRGAGVEDTKNKIGFSIASYNNKGIQSILPDTEVDLGVVSASENRFLGSGPSESSVTLDNNNTTISYKTFDPYVDAYSLGFEPEGNYPGYNNDFSLGREIYELSVNNGYAWTDVDSTFYYGITMVVGAADNNYEPFEIPSLGITDVSMALHQQTSFSNKAYLEVYCQGLDNTNQVISGTSIGYTDENGLPEYVSTSYIGAKVRREETYNQETQQMEEVENGEIYGVSFFYRLDFNSGSIDFSNLNKEPMYIKAHLNFQGTSYSDILTNKIINK